MRRHISLLTGILFLFPGFSLAKDYDLETILRLAKENNKEIKIAQADLKFASAQMKEAISTALPTIDINADYNRNFLENIFYFDVNGEVQSFKASFRNEYNLNATLNQTLFSFGKVTGAITAAKYFKKYTNFQFTDRLQDVLTSVKKAFYLALLLQKVWEVDKQSELSARENYENIRTKFESGVVSEFELLQAESRWQNAIPETMKSRKNHEIALNNLKALVDIPLREEVALIGDLENFPVQPDSMNFEDAFQTRPDYNSLLWEKKLQEKRVSIEYSNHLPSISGSLTYTYGARSDEFELANDNDNVILGLSLQIPIFSGGYTSAQVQKARVDVEKVKTRIQMANDNIRIELQNIWLRMGEAKERIQAARKSVQTARRAFEIAESRVEHGLATQLELKDSRVFLDQAQVTYYSAIFDYLEAYFDWENSIGQVNETQL